MKGCLMKRFILCLVITFSIFIGLSSSGYCLDKVKEKEYSQQVFDLWKSGKKEEALKLNQEFIIKYPESIRFLVDAAYFYGGQNKFDDATQMLNKALLLESKVNKEDSTEDLAYLHGIWLSIYAQQGKIKLAVEQGEEAVKYDPNSDLTYFALGGFYHLLNRDEDAHIALQKVIDIGDKGQSKGHMVDTAKQILDQLNKEGAKAQDKSGLSNNNIISDFDKKTQDEIFNAQVVIEVLDVDEIKVLVPSNDETSHNNFTFSKLKSYIDGQNTAKGYAFVLISEKFNTSDDPYIKQINDFLINKGLTKNIFFTIYQNERANKLQAEANDDIKNSSIVIQLSGLNEIKITRPEMAGGGSMNFDGFIKYVNNYKGPKGNAGIEVSLEWLTNNKDDKREEILQKISDVFIKNGFKKVTTQSLTAH